jgi:hypothetical protein
MMLTIQRIILIFITLICLSSFDARAAWSITGDAVGDNAAVLVPNPANNQEFIFVGKLKNSYFKITDGMDTYVVNCGDNDPLGQNLVLRKQDNPSETGLRIRYVARKDMFKVTLKVTRNSKQIIAERLTPPKELYIMGGPFNNNPSNWLLSDALEMERDADNPFIFYYRGQIRYNSFGDEPGNIKFLLGKSWNDNYHPAGTTDVPLLQATKIRLNGSDTKWTIPEDRSGDGYYIIKINTLEETIAVEFTPETAVPALNEKEKINIYSYHGKVYVRTDSDTRLEVSLFGIDGRKVARKIITGNAEISVPEGCYVVKATNADNERLITKVIIY